MVNNKNNARWRSGTNIFDIHMSGGSGAAPHPILQTPVKTAILMVWSRPHPWDTFNSVFNNSGTLSVFYCCHLCIAPSRLVLNSDPHFAARQMWAFTVVRVTTAAVYNFINGATLHIPLFNIIFCLLAWISLYTQYTLAISSQSLNLPGEKLG